jgi:AraC family transcriptional regulator, positive regulator of tynA and feaB
MDRWREHPGVSPMPVFSTASVAPRERVSYWNANVIRGFAKLKVRSNEPFDGSLTLGSLGSIGVSKIECDPFETERSRKEIAHSHNGDYFIHLQCAGRSTHRQGGIETVIREGEFFLADLRRPSAGALETRGSIVTIRASCGEIEARLGPTGQLVSRPLGSQNAVAGLTYSFLSMLPDRVDALESAAGPKIADQALDLLALAFAAEVQNSVTLSSARTTALTLLKAAIESRLHDPDLKPVTAAATAGISVRYANALLAEEGTGLEAYIITRRLERCRRTLDDPVQARRTIGDIAFSWGFSDLSHFARRFKAQYGCTPGDYRRQRA